MSQRADEALIAALGAVARALSDVASPAMVIGGLAVIARGVPRLTADIDVTIAGEGLDLDAFLVTLARQELAPRIGDALEFARRNQVLLLCHGPTGVPVDVSLAWLPFEREALERAESVDFGGVRLQVPQPRTSWYSRRWRGGIATGPISSACSPVTCWPSISTGFGAWWRSSPPSSTIRADSPSLTRSSTAFSGRHGRARRHGADFGVCRGAAPGWGWRVSGSLVRSWPAGASRCDPPIRVIDSVTDRQPWA